MDKLKELLDRIPYSMLLVAALGYIGYGYYEFRNSQESPLLRKVAEVDKAKKENADFVRKIDDAKNFFLTLEKKRMELRQLAQQLDEMKAVLTDQLDIPGLTTMFYNEAAKVGLTVVSFRPLASKNENYYAYQSFELQYKAVYIQLLVFLERLSEVQRIVRIESLTANPARGNSATSKYVDLSGRIELKAYKYLGSDADRLGRQETPGASPSPQPSAAPGGRT